MLGSNLVDKVKFSLFRRMGSINRFSNLRIVQPETNSSHVIDMEWILLSIYSLLDDHEKSLINLNECIKRILIHDLDEVVLSDIPRNVKYSSEVFYNMINDLSKKLYNEELEKLGSSVITWDDINHSKDNTDNGKLVSIIDKLQCNYKLRTEVDLQSSNKDVLVRYNESCKLVMTSLHSLVESGLGNFYRKFLSDYVVYEYKPIIERVNGYDTNLSKKLLAHVKDGVHQDLEFLISFNIDY